MHVLVFASVHSRAWTFSRSWDSLAVVQPGACSRGFASSCRWFWVEVFVHCPGFVRSARVIPLFEWDLGQRQF